MRIKKIVFCMVLASFMATFGFGKSAHAVSLNVDADVQQVVAVTAVTPLAFGTFSTDGTSADVTFDAGTSIAGGTGIVLLGSEVGGVVSINAPAASLTATVTTVATVLTDGAGNGADMTLVANCLGIGGSLGTDNGACTFTTTLGVQNIDVGGVLTVGTNQVAGNYTGTITVTANLQ
jgi:hypothetical protein